MGYRYGVGVRMEQLRRFFNLRNVLISETHAPLRACVGAIMLLKKPKSKSQFAYNMDIGDYGQTLVALMEV